MSSGARVNIRFNVFVDSETTLTSSTNKTYDSPPVEESKYRKIVLSFTSNVLDSVMNVGKNHHFCSVREVLPCSLNNTVRCEFTMYNNETTKTSKVPMNNRSVFDVAIITGPKTRKGPRMRFATKTRDGSAGKEMELHPSLTDASAPIIG